MLVPFINNQCQVTEKVMINQLLRTDVNSPSGIPMKIEHVKILSRSCTKPQLNTGLNTARRIQCPMLLECSLMSV